jgi:small subunit ribosomal protein S17
MAKILFGKVVSAKMKNTAIVEVSRLVPHPLYKKLLKRSKKYKIPTNGQELKIGQAVKIIETKPVSKDKHFALLQPKIQPKNKPEKEKPAAKPAIKKTKTKKEKKI